MTRALSPARLAPALLAVLSPLTVHAQAPKAEWTARLAPAQVRAGEHAQVVVTGVMKPGWHIYALPWPGSTVVPTTIELTPGKGLVAEGEPTQPPPALAPDPGAKGKVRIFDGAVAFGLPVRVDAGQPGQRMGSVRVRFQACDAHVCLLPETVEATFPYTVAVGPARREHAAMVRSAPAQPARPASSAGGGAPRTQPEGAPDATTRGIHEAQQRGLLAFLWISLVAGIASVFTPCVFPMIPITVSFFSKQKTEAGKTRLRGPLAYCLGIIATFTALGVLVTLLFGATGVQLLAASPVLNIGLTVLFVVLAVNLFGVFEIALPGWIVDRAHRSTGRTGLLGPLFMGLTFTLTSFTCTFPFAGTLLASAAAGGGLAYPLVGMLAFSTAFAAPFFLLALFPQYLERLPRSGSWLESVKAFMGFIELAAAVKFASNVDMAWELRILTRPIFLAIWAGILVVAALYLLGWLRLPHSDAELKIGWRRRVVGVATAAAGVYCLAAIEGAPLGQLEAFPPPVGYGRLTAAKGGPIQWISHYAEAQRKAAAERRAIFINFTGATCVNCREMEANVLPHPSVVKELQPFVTAELYTDRAEEEDRRNQQLQLKLVGSTAQPVYAAVTPDGKLLAAQQGRSSADEFARFVRDAHQAAQRAGLQ